MTWSVLDQLISRPQGDTICANTFGAGWRMTEFYDGCQGPDLTPSGGWSLVGRLEQAGIIRRQPRSDQEGFIQKLLPLLGDIALAAHGDRTAQILAEAGLPLLEQQDYRIAEPVRRIWAGDMDELALTDGLDEHDTALVKHVLSLVSGGPDLILAAGSIQVRELRRRADTATKHVLSHGDVLSHNTLAERFEHLAERAKQQPGTPWQSFAHHVQMLAARLRETR